MAEHDKVPRYFSDFLLEFGKFRDDNAKEHGNLAKWTAASVAAGTTIAIAALTFVIVYLG